MAATVTSKLIVSLTSLLANPVGLAAAQASIDTGLNQPLAAGTGANQCDRVYSESAKSIAAPYSPDLSGALLDALGNAFILARVRVLLVVADPTNSGDVIVGGNANAFLFGSVVADTVKVKPGGVMLLHAGNTAGYAVVAGTGDILTFTPSAGTQLFSFAILGASV
jgi:hypothetical protein